MGWIKMKLGEALNNREGRYKPNDPSIAGLKRIDKINFSGEIFLSDKGSNTDMILIKKGDLVISGINVEKGALTVYEGEEDILATIHYSSYIFNTDKIDIDFLKVFLRSPDFIQLLKEQVPGGIKTEIKPKHILPLEVYFPETTEEQKAIAAHFFEKEKKFNRLDEHITYQLTQLENLNRAILQEGVQGKLTAEWRSSHPELVEGSANAGELLKRIASAKLNTGKAAKMNRVGLKPNSKKKTNTPALKGEANIKPEDLPAGKAGIPFEIPENWVWCRLGEIADIVRGGSPRPAGDKTYYDGDIPFLKVADLTAGNEVYLYEHTFTIKEAGLYKTRFVEANTLMLTNSGATLGYPKICTFPTTFNDGIAAFLNLSEDFDKVYLFYFLKSLTSWFLKVASRGQGQPNLNTDIIGLTLFPMPPKEEQKRIVAEIEKQLAKTKQLKEHIIANQQATEQLLKALLHQAFEVREMEEVNN